MRRRHTSSMSSSHSDSDPISSTSYDSDSMLSLNITDEYSLHDYPSSRDVTPLPPSTPRSLTPTCISRSNSVPDIVITLNEGKGFVHAESKIMDASAVDPETNNGPRIRLDSEYSEIIPSFANTPSEMNNTDNVFYSDEESSNCMENTIKEISECNKEVEVVEPNKTTEDNSNRLDPIRPPPEMHKSKSENNLATMASSSRLNVKAKIASHISQRRGSIFSTLSSKFAVNDTDGSSRLPRSFHKSVKGALFARDQKARMKSRQRNEIKTAQKSSYIVLLFVALWIPLPIAVCLTLYYASTEYVNEYLQYVLDFQVFAFCIGNLSASANPIIYGLAIKKFRTVFLKLAETNKAKIVKRWKRTL